MSKHYIYKTLEGDTWDVISLDFYNDEYHTKELLKANPEHRQTLVFQGGVTLKIPILTLEESTSLPPWKRRVP